ncbi:hypothetical protein ACHAW6_005315 [Cyclotella cf. meneghiniana]
MEKECTRLTVDGSLIDYPWPIATPTTNLTIAKLLFNSVVLTPGAHFLTVDIKDFYLNTPMEHPEFVHLKFGLLPPEIVDAYGLATKGVDGLVYLCIEKFMYGLPQAGLLANKLLASHLNADGYYQCQFTLGLLHHKWHTVTFSLVVDNFGVKTVGLTHAKHLRDTLQKYYKVSIDWTGEFFCGISLAWDYNNNTVALSMLGYIDKALRHFQHVPPMQPRHVPYKSAPIQFGGSLQFPLTDTAASLTPPQIKHIQQIVGTLLYYSLAVDPTLAAALNAIASRQSQGTEAVMDACKQLLDYVAAHPNAMIQYCASDMALALDTDGSYLSEHGGKSRAAAYMYLTKQDEPNVHNGAVLVLSAIIKHVMASASETELEALFYGCKKAIPLCTALEEKGHPQPGPTPVTRDNSTAIRLTMQTMLPEASKAIDMCFQ